MRKEMEDQVMQSEAQIAQLRKKNNDAVNDLNDQLDHAQKAKSKWEFNQSWYRLNVMWFIS